MELQRLRGPLALVATPAVVELARELDRAIADHRPDALELAERELEAIRALEVEQGHRIHKGHALHQAGIALYSRDPLRARAYFHAAHVEDVRTYPDGRPEGFGRAFDMLESLYQERHSAIRDLEDLASDTVSDPLELARKFEADQGDDLGIYVGIVEASRDESDLDGVERSDLVFVAGTHANPDHMQALRDAATRKGLKPLIVREFRDQPGDNDYTKSERIMARCSLALFDLSSLQGQMMELPMAGLVHKIPFFAGFINGTVSGELHGTGMVKGFLEKVGVEPEAVVNTEQLGESARAWLTKQLRERATRLVGEVAPPGPLAPYDVHTGPGTAAPYLPMPVDYPYPDAGASAGNFATGSNTPLVLSEESNAIPSGEGYIPEAPFVPSSGLVDRRRKHNP